MITRIFHSTSHTKLAMFLVLMFPFVLIAQQNQNTAQPTNTNASPTKSDSKVDESKEVVYRAKDVTQKAVVLKFKQPSYTERAREKGIQGTVYLRAILHKSGEVRNITIMKSLPDGLTEEAVKTAKSLKVKPAIKDGQAVSQYTVLSFPFRIGY